MKNKKFSVGGLFSGVGGIELGFEKAGFKINWANEYDKYACKTYRLNHPAHNLIEDDIYNLNPKELDTVDILVGGFPCQAFSVAGYRKGFKDPRGNLFFEIARIIDELKTKPKVLLLENVKNLNGHDGGKTKEAIINILHNFGYYIDWHIYNTADFTDIPQNRERTIIVCFLKKNSFTIFQNNRIKKIKKRKKISDLLEVKEVSKKYYYQSSSQYYQMLRESMKRTDTLYQLRRIYVRENQSKLCPTLTANMGTGGHNVPLLLQQNKKIRKLTPQECFKFQGFDKIKFPSDVPNTQLYKLAGNSVTVNLIEKIANTIRLSMD